MATWLCFLAQLTKLQSEHTERDPRCVWENLSSILFASLALGRRSLWPIEGRHRAWLLDAQSFAIKTASEMKQPTGHKQNLQSTLKARAATTGMRNKKKKNKTTKKPLK